MGGEISFESDQENKNKDFKLDNGLLTVPEGVSSFTAKIKIVDDAKIEGEEFLTLSVPNHEVTASIIDNDIPEIEPALMLSITGNTVKEGSDDQIIFEYILDKETPYEQVFQSVFSTKADGLMGEGKLAVTGLDTEPGSGFTANSGVKLDLDRTMTVPRGVKQFSMFIDVIDDNIPELTEELVSSVGVIEGSSHP